MHPETGYKLCMFCENRARDTPLRGVYIPHFDQISAKISVLGVLCPYRCTDGGEIWHGGGDHLSCREIWISGPLVTMLGEMREKTQRHPPHKCPFPRGANSY